MRSFWLVLALAACAAPPVIQAETPTQHRTEWKSDSVALQSETPEQSEARFEAMLEKLGRQADKNAQAREDCAYRGAIANATAPGGVIGQVFAGIEVQAACMEFYQRTGRVPG